MSPITLSIPASDKSIRLVYVYCTKAHEAITLDTTASPETSSLTLSNGTTLSSDKEILFNVAAQHDTSLVGTTDAEKAEVLTWISEEDTSSLMKKIEEALVTRTYLVGNSLSLADLTIFAKLASLIPSLEKKARLDHVNTLRWFDHIQHILPESVLSTNGISRIPIDQTPPPRESKPEKSQRKGKDEAAAPETASAASAKGGKKEKKEKKEKKPKAPAAPAVPIPSQIDLRVGRIIHCEKHPDADSLYVEKVDVGEEEPRTVVSGLVRFVPLEEMQNRAVILVCNLKPVSMRGVKSHAMVLCAGTADKSQVEIMSPPADAKPGTRVYIEGYQSGEPDAVLNPKKKVWEAIQPGYRTAEDRSATWVDADGKAHAFVVEGSDGKCTAPTIVGGGIS